MAKDKILGMIPTNDHTVFVDEDGRITERLGIAYVIDAETGYEEERYIDEYGYICKIADNNTYTAILGKRGDTVTLRQLWAAFKYANEPERVIENVEKYLTVSKEGLEDTVVFSFDTRVMGKYHARLDVKSETFPFLGTIFFDLSEDDYKIRNDDGQHNMTIEEALIPTLVVYSKALGKRVNVEVYFAKCFYPNYTEDEMAKINKQIYHYEEMFLPRLRRFINEKLDEALAKEETDKAENEKYWRTVKSNKERFASKYDKDPNLM